jgi:hypothetical protein
MKKFMAGMLFGIVLTTGALWGWRAQHARGKPRPTSQVINQPTKARQVRELKPGRDPDERFIPMHVERH